MKNPGGSGNAVLNNSRWRIQATSVPAGVSVTPSGWQDSTNKSWSQQTLNFETFEYVAGVNIKVTAGGDRNGIGASGSVLGAAPNGTVFQAVRSNGDTSGGPFECTVTDGSGSCVITGLPSNFRWNVSVKSVPNGWFLNSTLGAGSDSASNYLFQTTSTLTGNTVYEVTASGTNHNWPTSTGQTSGTAKQDQIGNRFTQDRLAVSRTNPELVPACGLNVAFVLDQSNSMNESVGNIDGQQRNRQWVLKQSMTQLIEELTGTPTQFALYSYASSANVSGSVGLTSLASTASAAPLTNYINGLPGNPEKGNEGGTNWDRGLAQITNPSQYDLVIFFTDGMPTFYDSPHRGPGGSTAFQMVEQAVFSSNAIKATGVPVYGIGAGIGTSNGAKANLRAVSGTTEGQDYWIVSEDPSSVVNRLKELAGGACDGTLTIQKQIQDHLGNLIQPSPEDANGWDFTNTIAGAGTSIDGSATTGVMNGQNGFDTVNVTGTAGSVITVTEDLQQGYSFVGATCSVNGVPVQGQTVDGTKVTFTVPQLQPGSGVSGTCVFTNKRPAPPSANLTLVKVVETGDEPAATWKLSAQQGDNTPVINQATTGTPAAGPVGVTPGEYALTESNGPDGYEMTALSCVATPSVEGAAFTGSFNSDTDTVTLNNGDDVTCTFTNELVKPKLTLIKVVDNQYNGSGAPIDWTLSATLGQTVISGPGAGDGRVIEELVDPGEYSLDETGPQGYTWEDLVCVNAEGLPALGDRFEAERENSTVFGGSVTLQARDNVTCTFTNKDRPGNVVWAKVDQDSQPLAGSVWTIVGTSNGSSYPSPGVEVTDCVTAGCAGTLDTDPEPGKFKVESLNWGDYTLTETQPPPGYIRDGDPEIFEISGESLNASFEAAFTNQQRSGPNLPLTGGLATAGFFVLGAGLLGGSVIVAETRRRRRAQE